uniref:Cyclin-dependent kinase inhibitor domain-containing protein n=1 Tax=Coturnix japonica TaxID=93934 RepID=A0A8C2TZM9_COTJA
MELLLDILTRERRQGEKMVHTRRNLFGPVDQEQLHWDFQQMLHSSMEAAQRKWNFNFLLDVPLEGFVQWEELEGHEVPAFYRSCVVREPEATAALEPAPLQEGKSSPIDPGGTGGETKDFQANRSWEVPEGKKGRRMSLTDYYSGKKQVRTNTQAAAKKPTA